MCVICKGNYDINMTVLDCCGCKSLTINLRHIHCWECPNLENIPSFSFLLALS